MKRQLEPELMDTPTEATDYDQMDHSTVNRAFVDELLAAIGLAAIGPKAADTVSVVDLGTGTAQIPIELCQRDVRFGVTAVDAARHMLDLAERNVRAAGYQDRIELQLADAKLPSAGQYDVVMSNSIVHHLPEPAVFFDRAGELVRPGGHIFARDLSRPADEAEWQHLVDTYVAGETAHAQQMFGDSLRAALTLEEVRQLVAARGYDPSSVVATSDRHWTWSTQSERTP